jgi:hypothetical protein
MQYTITVAALSAPAKARLAQCKLARETYRKQKRKPWGSRRVSGKGNAAKAAVNSEFASVTFINGTTIPGCLPVKALAQWARTFGPKAAVSITPLPDVHRVRVDCGMSRIDVHHFRGVQGGLPPSALGPTLRLVAPVNGGEFRLDTTPALP